MAESPLPSRTPTPSLEAAIRQWKLLWLRPREFFSGELTLGIGSRGVLAAWCWGIANAIGQLDGFLQVVKKPTESSPVDSWTSFWSSALILGAIGGLTFWWLGGWWYGVRLRWAGAKIKNQRRVRAVHAYASFVAAAPAVGLAVVETFVYDSYRAVDGEDSLVSVLALLVLLSVFWSLRTSYVGAVTRFPMNRRKAFFWLALLPGGFYFFGVVLSVIAT